MKNTLKIGFLAIMFAFVFVACKPKTAVLAVDAAADELANAATEVVGIVDSKANAIVHSTATVISE